MYNLNEHIAIDEGMLKWRGRLSFRVYNKNKPIKYGIKSYILCDSGNSYCWSLDVNATEGIGTKYPASPRHLSQQVAHFYMDNFYNSVELAESLLKDKVHTGGTMRLKRGQGKDVRLAGTKQNKLAKGQSVARDNGKVMTICCMDKKPVGVLSSKHNGSMIEISRRKKGGHGEIEVFKPACICDYNQHMSGIDRMDQMISYYPCSRKSFKWWKKLLFYVLEISIHNADVLYNLRGKKMSLYDFQLTIVRAFCKVDDVITSSSEDKSPTPA